MFPVVSNLYIPFVLGMCVQAYLYLNARSWWIMAYNGVTMESYGPVTPFLMFVSIAFYFLLDNLVLI